MPGVVVPGHDDRLGDLRRGVQDSLDLARLDPVPAHLHLLVGAPEIVQLPVGGPPDPVAGAVHPPAVGAERISHETLGREPRAVEVTTSHLRSGEIQLPRDPDRHRAQGGVQHVRPDVAQRAADHRTVSRPDRTGQRVHRALGRAVEVVRRRAGHRAQLPPQRLAQRLAAEHEHGRPVRVAAQQTGGQKLLQVRGCQVEEVDAVRADVVHQGAGIEPGLFVDDVQLVPVRHQQRTFP
ncbi:hypothetical protein GCM10022629_85040 [Amorphoplanes auranticolor]